MRTRFLPPAVIRYVLLVLLGMSLASGPMVQAWAVDEEIDDRVTTRWLPDPFPNLPPRAVDRHATVEMNTATHTPSVLLGVYDVENDPLALAGYAQPTHGTVSANGDGTFTYTPPAGFIGDDRFYENDNACRQVIGFAQLRRNRHGYIDRIDLGERYYEFAVDDQGVVTELVHTPADGREAGRE